MSHVTWTPISGSKGQRSRSTGRFTHRRVKASGGCSGQHGNVFDMGQYCYVASARRRAGAWAPTGRRGAGHNVSPRAQLVSFVLPVHVQLLSGKQILSLPHRML